SPQRSGAYLSGRAGAAARESSAESGRTGAGAGSVAPGGADARPLARQGPRGLFIQPAGWTGPCRNRRAPRRVGVAGAPVPSPSAAPVLRGDLRRAAMNAVTHRVLDEAIDWQLCLDSGDATDQERQAFTAWLAAHPEHARAWQQLGGLDQQLAVAEPAPARRALLRRPTRRRLGSSLLVLVLLGGLLGLSAQRPLSDFLADEITARGEQRSLLLPDQTRVHLNSASALDIDFTAQHRHLTLRSGEILVETAKGDSRPLWVMTEHGRLRPLGTRFLVRLEEGATRLTVLQSSVAAYAQTAGE